MFASVEEDCVVISSEREEDELSAWPFGLCARLDRTVFSRCKHKQDVQIDSTTLK